MSTIAWLTLKGTPLHAWTAGQSS